MGREYARAVNTRTVRPSTTVAALASLATGVAPESHGLVKPGLEFLTRLGALRPLGKELTRHRLRVTVVAAAMNPATRAIAGSLTAAAGAKELIAEGRNARETAQAALSNLAKGEPGLVMVYLPDCDRAGHAFGWMSAPYLSAAGDIDAAVGILSASTDDSLVIVVADHGGGGIHPTDHDEPHPLNDRIPLVLAGPHVRRHKVITEHTSLLDLPPTILWALGVDVPLCYEGTVIHQAFAPARPVEAMAV
jgi:predicted AlkP superfamily pyrophosphatase or phosphodiesterase